MKTEQPYVHQAIKHLQAHGINFITWRLFYLGPVANDELTISASQTQKHTMHCDNSLYQNNKICTSSNHCQQNGNWRFVDLLEDVFEPAIILLQNGVLCAHVQQPFLLYSILETAVSEAGDRLKHKVTHIKHLRTHWSLNSHKETFKLYFIT